MDGSAFAARTTPSAGDESPAAFCRFAVSGLFDPDAGLYEPLQPYRVLAVHTLSARIIRLRNDTHNTK